MSQTDPFATAILREQTLRTWRDNPRRFREDANMEEDHARGYYRDRVIIELAQNAADAAPDLVDSGGCVRFSLVEDAAAPSGWSLRVANTGQGLSADGVASLSGLRASAKRGSESGTGRIGHFGVGFSAVRAVSDEITIRSQLGGVQFSFDLTREALRDELNEELREEIRRRGSELPILRLPWPASTFEAVGPGPENYVTEITIALRDEQAVELVRELLAEVDDRLLMALPRLREISVTMPDEAECKIADLSDYWLITRRTGAVPGDLLDTLPVEERERAQWEITWATPRKIDTSQPLLEVLANAGDSLLTRGTLFAPTPTDEPLTVPGFLIATLPLEPTRRRVRPGVVTDWIIDQIGATAAQHAQKLTDPLQMVPLGLPGGEIDAALREAVRTALASAPILRTIEGRAIAPEQASSIVLAAGTEDSLSGATPLADRIALEELASGHEGIVDIGRHRLTHAAALGVRARNVADLVAEIPAGRTPQRWRETYENLSGLTREVGGSAALASLPVPLVDGRVVSGARGVFAITDDAPESVLREIANWGLRIGEPGAHHPLLESLGAAPIFACELLDEPEVRNQVRHLTADYSGAEIESASDEWELGVDSVLHLVASAVKHLPPAQRVSGPIRAWLADLPLLTEDSQIVGAGGTLLPGSRAQELFIPDELVPLSKDWARQWSTDVWRAIGVRDGLVIVQQGVNLDAWDIDASIDQALDDASIGILDSLDQYLDELADYWLEAETSAESDTDLDAAPELLSFELNAIADLDIVAGAKWPEVEREVLEWLDDNAEPVTVPGRTEPFPHYVRWWLTRNDPR